jgi:hypothetical protein
MGDAFIARITADRGDLVYSGFIAGQDDDAGYGVAVEGAGHAYVSGETESEEDTFPVSGGPDLGFDSPSGGYEASVAEVKPDGSGFVYAGYVGGADEDHGSAITVDTAGNAYVTGETLSDE